MNYSIGENGQFYSISQKEHTPQRILNRAIVQCLYSSSKISLVLQIVTQTLKHTDRQMIYQHTHTHTFIKEVIIDHKSAMSHTHFFIFPYLIKYVH